MASMFTVPRAGEDPDQDAVERRIEAESAASSEPQFFADRGVYTCAWGYPTHVTIDFERLRSDNRSGELTAEIDVCLTNPGMKRRVHQARLNLSSTQTRSTTAKHLASRTTGMGIDWPDLLERAITLTIAAHRRGEPEILLRDAPRPMDAGYLLGQLILGRLPTMFFGAGGEGKSWMALAVAAAIQSGRADILGMAPTTTRTVAYCDWEMDAWAHRERFHALLGDPMPEVIYVKCRGAIWDEVDRLQRIFRDRGVGYAVIDSVGMACGGVPIETSEAAQRFNDAVSRLEVGTLQVAHRTKGEGSEEHPFGSIFWHNNARATWLVKKQQEITASSFVVGLFNKKSNTGPIAAPMAFEIDFGGERVRISRRGVADVAAFAPQVSCSWRMQQALAGGPLTYAELAERLEESVDTVRKAAARGEGKIFVRTSSADGIYRVVLLGRSDD